MCAAASPRRFVCAFSIRILRPLSGHLYQWVALIDEIQEHYKTLKSWLLQHLNDVVVTRKEGDFIHIWLQLAIPKEPGGHTSCPNTDLVRTKGYCVRRWLLHCKAVNDVGVLFSLTTSRVCYETGSLAVYRCVPERKHTPFSILICISTVPVYGPRLYRLSLMNPHTHSALASRGGRRAVENL